MPVASATFRRSETANLSATMDQIHRCAEAGADIIRVAVPRDEDAEALKTIVAQSPVPIIADIHFNHTLALKALDNGAACVRINPGNIGDESRVQAVVDCAKAHHTPIRIGVNAGSIEPVLRQKYGGPTTEAMIESALKHVALLEKEGFTDIVLSLKASNVRDTVDAYRAISKRVDYPLHVGVTETGDVASGIIKSAAGIGSLLLDGIGDTIRVSLTDDPVKEVETGLKILRAVGLRRDDVEIVSCPTCGRTRVDVMRMVELVNSRLPHKQGYLKVAVMGCAVNGPGEARDADIGVAFGDGNGILFEKGEKVYHGAAEDVVERLITRASEMLAEQKKA